MFSNYLKIAFRNIRKQKGYAFINIFGFTLGIAACLLILLYVAHELSYDRFNEKADRIYRLASDVRIASQEPDRLATSAAPAAAAMMQDFPEVETATRIDNIGQTVVRSGDQMFNEDNMFYADPNFFEVFTFPMIAGNPATALNDPKSVVLTKSTAERYFGEQSALGKTLSIGESGEVYQVTGVVEDVPDNSHFDFDLLLSMKGYKRAETAQWGNMFLYTYLVLRKDADPASLEAKFPAVYSKYYGPLIETFLKQSWEEFRGEGNYFRFILQPLTDIHLHSHLRSELQPPGSVSNLYIFSSIALFILLIACINFMNLSTARSVKRAREVGVRKVLGSDRQSIIKQFLAESLMYTAVATLLAIGFVEFFLGTFNNIAGVNLSIGLFHQWWMLAGLVVVALGVGMIAGGYPALYLAGFQPADVLKGTVKSGRKSGRVRSGLVIFQFAISIGLILCTTLVYSQLRYIQTKDLGFDKENVLVINNANRLGNQKAAFYQAVTEQSGVVSASICQALPAEGGYNGTLFKSTPPEFKQGAPQFSDKDILFSYFQADDHYLETMELRLKSGRNFSSEYASDSAAAIVNEVVVSSFGWEDPVGQYFYATGSEGTPRYHVIGVTENYHFESLHTRIKPVVLLMGNAGNRIAVRLQPGTVAGMVNTIKQTWQEFAPGAPFTYSFLDQDFDALFRAEQRFGTLVGYFTLLTIFIACLGAFGLAAFSAEQRTKEIGIRKALGASMPNIVLLLTRDFTRLVLIAFIIAVPVAYYFMHRWLQDFAYRVGVGPGSILITGVIALTVAFLSVGWQAVRAGRANPVEALRYE